jgi:hypothetical protein
MHRFRAHLSTVSLALLLSGCGVLEDLVGDEKDSPEGDRDGDGYTAADGDCDDTDADAYPGAADTPYDGVDADCGGGSDYDADGDGVDAEAHGGTDCDDTDADRAPGEPEAWLDGIDQDCDGVADVQGAACDADIGVTLADGTRATLDLCGAWALEAGLELATGELRSFAVVLEGAPEGAECRVELAISGVCGAGYYAFGGALGTLEVVSVDCEGVDGGTTYAADGGYVRMDVAEAGDGAPVTIGDAVALRLSGELRGIVGDVGVIDGTFALSGTLAAVPDRGNDCSSVDADADADGVPDAAYGGDDCDDADPSTSAGIAVNDSTTACMTDADGDGYGGADPADGVTPGTDCDDADASVNPGADEVCGGLDDDCDGLLDLDDPSLDPTSYLTWYRDRDGDGFGDDATATEACEAPDGHVIEGGDCDDARAASSPVGLEACDARDEDEDCDGLEDDDDPDVDAATTTAWFVDADADGYGDASDAGVYACDPVGSRTAAAATDCDDTTDSVNPGETEICDSADTDEDCDGLAESADPSVSASTLTTWYADADGDGYGGTSSTRACDASGTYTATTRSDCDDADASVSPAATEVCDAADADEDCDGTVDDDDRSLDTSTASTYYRDADGDGWAPTGAASLSLCDPSGLYAATVLGDCDDTDDAVSPDAAEVCDDADTDDDCDGLADDDDSPVFGRTTWYADADGDGSGDSARTTSACDAAGVYTADDYGDCDDGDPSISPLASEVCDAADTDEDCDGLADDDDRSVSAATKSTWYVDADRDGYGDDSRAGASYCDATTTYTVSTNTDCDDAAASISPAGTEECDSADTDEDCDGRSDDADSSASSATKTRYYADADRDGYGRATDAGALACDATSARSATAATDCDDTTSAVSPAATEVCDTSDTDDDCDGLSDDLDPGVSSATYSTWYVDSDRDGYGNAALSARSCDATTTYRTSSSTDCDDTRSSVNPGASETWYDGTDGNCDGRSDYDRDIDGYDAEAYGGEDCDDTEEDVNPSSAETWYDGVDGDCDELSDYDQDYDGYDAETYGGDDCLDTNADAWPGNDETWYDGVDGDCDGANDYDQDGDGYTSDAWSGTDCDDVDDGSYPGGTEAWFDGVDADCDGYDERLGLRSADVTISGAAISYQSGFPRTGGDLDGDGWDDLVVSSANGTGTYGSHSVIYGPITSDLSLSTVTDVVNVNSGSGAGYVGAIVQDTNGDGFDDYLIGENGGFIRYSYSYLLPGPITGTNTVASAITFTAGYGSRRGGYYLGNSVADAGDVDGDGYGDFILGAPWGDYGCTSFEERGYTDYHCGNAFLFYGPVTASVSVDSAGADAVLVGTRGTTDLSLNEQIGIAVTGAGDLDGDGFDDVAVAGTLADYSGSDSGVVWVHNGPISGSLAVTSGDASVRGDTAGDRLGTSLTVQGDIDGDGYDDLVVGAPYADEGGSDAGGAYVFYGPLSGASGAATADVQLYGAAAGDLAGSEVSIVENIDGAGANAVVVSAPYNDLVATSAGAVYAMVSPGTGVFYLDDAPAAVLTGRNTSDLAGSPARSADLDGDGAGDLAIGVYAEDLVDTNAGAVFLLFGAR